ncbi:DMT family transporter [Mycetocola zhujimingii]|uniref:EamA/RhaT family transporter n=1 Tax=Mycetocola zhujimingii TaxID=2079792 RepID=A0A2U1TGV7_9MICO|nr:DMT family transporter [Mycetocola zhujimingii]AWB86555.1 EamA family transporter [Mycetocola zhujimingii]PWC08105.1 EamA/RhaT family transporter [Mycetocola zhujimingii]
MLLIPRRRLLSKPELALVLITVVWGATFLVVHIAVQYSGPWFFVGMRFLAAGIISAVIFAKALSGLTWKEIGAGSAIGVMIYLGYGLQTVGLQSISSSTSAFITALYVPLVPILQWMVFRKAPQLLTWIGVALAFIGLILLADPGSVGFTFGAGEIVTLVSTLPIALEIILISVFAGKVHLGRVTVVQLLVAGLLALATMPVVGEQVPEFSWVWLGAAVALGAASCIIQLTMNWAQRSVSPTRATIIYAAEPVWAGIIGRLAGDRLPAIAILGAVFIVAGAVVSELNPRKRAAVGNTETAVAPDDEPEPALEDR